MRQFAVVSAALALGCVGPEPEPQSPRTGYVFTGGWGCRTCEYRNSPIAGLDPIGSFRVGEPDDVNLGLVKIRLWNGTELDADVSTGELVGTSAGQSYKGTALVGGQLVFLTPERHELTIDIYSYAPHGDWVTGADVSTYGLSYLDQGEDISVCPGFNLDETSVVVMPEELYDDQTKTVESAKGFASLACRGHAVAKMKMMGYAPADAYGSSVDARQATYKMLTADYCGTGRSFTQFGQPLDWGDAIGNFPAPVPGVNVEAKWTPAGADCLDTPRLVQRKEVDAYCKLSHCTGDVELGSASWITWLP